MIIFLRFHLCYEFYWSNDQKGLVSYHKFPVARVIICGAIRSHTSFDILMSRLAYEKVNSRK